MSNQIISDQMTSKDRLEAFYSGKPYGTKSGRDTFRRVKR